MGNSLKERKVGASDGSRDEEERAYWVKRLKEERQEHLKSVLMGFLKNFCDEPYIGYGFRQRHSNSTIEVVFKTPKIVAEFSEFDCKKGETIRREMFEAEHITDPDQICFYWDRLKNWLGDTLRFGEIWDNEESAK